MTRVLSSYCRRKPHKDVPLPWQCTLWLWYHCSENCIHFADRCGMPMMQQAVTISLACECGLMKAIQVHSDCQTRPFQESKRGLQGYSCRSQSRERKTVVWRSIPQAHVTWVQ